MSTSIDQTLDAAAVTTQAIREFVQEWAAITTPARVEVVSAADDARLIQEALDAGELLRAGEGRYYARSHVNDTARSEARTVVATSNPSDRGVYNNWHPANLITATLRERMRAASAGKTMYVVPYLMAVPGTPLAPFAAGVQLTDDRTVVLHMIRMARVGLHLFDDLDDPDFFVRGVHVTGDLDTLNQGTPEDQRLFATIADQRTILHYGSAYGGNALLGKIAHALRLASYDGWVSGRFLAEQFLLLGIVDTHTGRTYHVCGGFPSASGKTNLAMTLPPDTLGDRYRVEFYGDDIAWLWAGDDGRLYGMNPENGIFGVAKDTNETTNPVAVDAMGPGSGAIFTNVARHDLTGEVWWEGKTPEPPTQIEGWRDWAGHLITDRDERTRNDPWAHPNSRFATALTNIPTLAPAADHPAGVPIDAIIFGGRTSDREPLIRAITDLAEVVYDGLTLGAEATFAAEGLDGQLRYDPMSMRPFLSYPEGDYAQHWLSILGNLAHPPIFAHVNWFQRDPDDGRYLWPGYRDNLRALLWLIDHHHGRANGQHTPVGTLPTADELDLDGLNLQAGDLDRLLHIDRAQWGAEMGHRSEHLAQFPNLPKPIRDVHKRITTQLEE
ncbi:phosphoenolpyruvate carboxykinase (GTP) [Micrococcoides hystricis]|uniref:Phosphoenolpyruvate carboxykinase [GTP] n=1 Tax=Micrococcoides hystricis TaxID=1572761 RepID=A0ABV6P9D3_9MICC